VSAARRTVLVTDAGRGSSLAIIRSLGGRGWRVIAADADRASPGFRSRHVSARVRYPNPHAEPDAAAEQLIDAAGRGGVDLLVPVTDEVILPLVARRAELPAGCVLALPSLEALDAAWDKAATLEIAGLLGIPLPPTPAGGSGANPREIGDELGWPVVVKPRRSRSYRPGRPVEAASVSFAADAGELARQLQAAGGPDAAIVQGWVPGEGHGIELLCHDGRPLAAFQHRRVREVPVTGGASAHRTSVALDPVMLDHAVRLLAALRWTGLAMVEFRVGPAGPCLMELNGRVWGSLPLAVASGMDFPARMAELFVDGPPPDGVALATDYRLGVRASNLALEVHWIAAVALGATGGGLLPVPPRRAALRAALDLVRPGIILDVQRRDDPLPGLADLVRIARTYVGRARGVV
jgi:predicted ATP-grasp superfamily ATP-dependent carboligase